MDIRNDETACGCDGECNVNALCCNKTVVVALSLPDYHFCTPLQTSTDCSSCGDICTGQSQCCLTSPTSSTCANILTDNANCGVCGRVCSATEEACCGGECVDITTSLNCGACGVACPQASFCCYTPPAAPADGFYSCMAYLNADDMCGCPTGPTNCTMLPPPPENHDGTFDCCKGECGCLE